MLAEELVYQHLKTNLEVPVYMEHPEHSAGRTFVIIQRVGGSDGWIHEASFAIQSYGKTLFTAASLNEEVKQAMDRLILRNEVSKVALDSDYNYTDTSTKSYRYQAIFDLVLF